MKNLFVSIVFIFLASSLVSCDKSQANVQTLISNDCGVTWELIPPGSTVPKRITQCELKTTIPGSPMDGNSRFKTSFANKVKAVIDLDYQYEIIDPIKFINEAKYLAKSNSDADDVSSNSTRFESAENSIIDKIIKDIAREALASVDIVDFDQAEFEGLILEKSNVRLAQRGVRISFISFVPEPSEQTAQAIDVATAMRIYEVNGMKELGEKVMAAKAGANKIVINGDENKVEPEEE